MFLLDLSISKIYSSWISLVSIVTHSSSLYYWEWNQGGFIACFAMDHCRNCLCSKGDFLCQSLSLSCLYQIQFEAIKLQYPCRELKKSNLFIEIFSIYFQEMLYLASSWIHIWLYFRSCLLIDVIYVYIKCKVHLQVVFTIGLYFLENGSFQVWFYNLIAMTFALSLSQIS